MKDAADKSTRTTKRRMFWGMPLGGTKIRQISPLSMFFDRRPAGVPRAYWLRLMDGESGARWIAIASVVVAVAMLCVLGGMLVMGSSSFPWYAILITNMFPAFSSLVLSAATRRFDRRFAATIVENGGLVCIECGYSMVGSADEGICPECGTTFDRDHVVQTWQAFMPEEFDAYFDRRDVGDIVAPPVSSRDRAPAVRQIGLINLILRIRPSGIPSAYWCQLVGRTSAGSWWVMLSVHSICLGLVGLLAMVFALPVAYSSGFLSGHGLEMLLVAGLMTLVGVFSLFISLMVVRGRVIKLVRDNDYRVCLECARIMGDEVFCRGCGAVYEREHAMRVWRAALPELRL